MPRLQPITTQCSEQDQQMINLSNSINYHRSAKNAKSKKIYAYLSYELGDQFWFFDHLGASHWSAKNAKSNNILSISLL